jgi:RES domain-containing protein
VPSFAAGATGADVSVVFWDWSRDPPHQIRVIDDDQRLPKDASPWR